MAHFNLITFRMVLVHFQNSFRRDFAHYKMAGYKTVAVITLKVFIRGLFKFHFKFWPIIN